MPVAITLTKVLTNNCEVMYNLTSEDIKSLEAIDSQLIYQVFSIPAKTSQCLMMLEMGITPLRYIIKMKRLTYYHHLSNVSDESLPKQVLNKQFEKPLRGERVKAIEEDLTELKLQFSIKKLLSLPRQKF